MEIIEKGRQWGGAHLGSVRGPVPPSLAGCVEAQFGLVTRAQALLQLEGWLVLQVTSDWTDEILVHRVRAPLARRRSIQRF
jgi:hypothetical protein